MPASRQCWVFKQGWRDLVGTELAQPHKATLSFLPELVFSRLARSADERRRERAAARALS